MRVGAVAAFVACAAVSLGCASAPKATVPDSETARQRYAEGMERLLSGDYETSTRIFTEVAQFPRFMTYASLGRLRLGDSLYFQDRYIEALDVYEEFVALYPRSPNVPYAQYMSALAVAARMPADVPFFSPGERLDQSRVLQARDRLAAFVRANPESPFAADAAARLAAVRERLFRHHRFVAEFYARRDNDRAEVGRRAEMAWGYPEWGADQENLARVEHLARRLEEIDLLRQAQTARTVRFPGAVKDPAPPADNALAPAAGGGDRTPNKTTAAPVR